LTSCASNLDLLRQQSSVRIDRRIDFPERQVSVTILTLFLIKFRMATHVFSLSEAKAKLSELVDLAAAGEPVVITRHGKPVLELVRPRVARKPIDIDSLRKLTERQPKQRESAGAFMRRLREDARY
jgi:antitoxin (DNA-binding transcriptional repressor) of toxin-antitoxin stability system